MLQNINIILKVRFSKVNKKVGLRTTLLQVELRKYKSTKNGHPHFQEEDIFNSLHTTNIFYIF